LILRGGPGTLLSFFTLFVVLPQQISAQTGDSEIFRILYDKVADATTTGVDLEGRVTQVFLMELPGLGIRREDFDPDLWAANNFVDPMPAANYARLVDRVPKYNSLAFTDSGRTISSIWNLVLRQFVVPLDLNPAAEDLAEYSRQQLANSTLEDDVQFRFDQWQGSLENSLSERQACLASREPSICAQQAVVWREDLRRSWYALEVVKSQLQAAQSRLISLQVRDLTTMFTAVLERSEQAKRVDVGASTYGEEFYHTTATPSNWWTWFPLDLSSYNVVIDENAGTTDISVPTGSTIINGPLSGTATINAAQDTIRYTANDGFIGGDRIVYLDNNGEAITVTIAVNGDVANADPFAFTTVSVSAADTQVEFTSKYQLLHRNNFFVQNSGAITYTGSFGGSLNTQTGYTFASGSFSIEFELAKVQITRRWFDTTLFFLTPVGVRGVRQFGFSDGNPLFTKETDFLFDLLPTHMVIARNIRLSSDTIQQQQSTMQSVETWGSSNSVRLGPFVAGRSNLNYKNSNTYSRASFTGSGDLEIQGPQIIGWVCSPMPAFPTADFNDIEDLNDIQMQRYSNVRLTQKAFDKGLGVEIIDGQVHGLPAGSSSSTSNNGDSATDNTGTG